MCGVLGIVAKPGFEHQIAEVGYGCLLHLKHRGPHSAGLVVSSSDGWYHQHKGQGTINIVFHNIKLRRKEWHGMYAMGHVRYGTSGSTDEIIAAAQAQRALQPKGYIFRGERGFMSFNGNLTPSCVKELFFNLYGRPLEDPTIIVDTELMIESIERSNAPTFKDALFAEARAWRGAFSVVFLHNSTLYAIRDPHGFHPLVFGENKFGYIVASEDNIFDDGKFPESKPASIVQPGECVILKRLENGVIDIQREQWHNNTKKESRCMFEDIYFQRFDSTSNGQRIQLLREDLGWQLAYECPPPPHTDFVIGVPDSGVPAGYGYAKAASLPYEIGAFHRLHTERTFLAPVKELREKGAEFKLQPVPEKVAGKVIAVVDDSIVRGNVIACVTHRLKHAGAKEVHVYASCPPITHPCWYGIDHRDEKELIARRYHTIEGIREAVNKEIFRRYGHTYTVDSISYLSLRSMKKILQQNDRGVCDACWTGNYPVE